MRHANLTIIIALGVAAFAQAPSATTLVLDVPPELVQGQAATLRATLTDASGAPVSGELVIISTTLPFFDYVSTMELGQARTNFRGEATFSFTPTVAAERSMTAAFEGSATLAPSRTQQPFAVAAGTLAPAPTPPAPVLPWLTRGRATALLLPAMLGVWFIFAYALYQMARIAREGHRASSAPGGEAGT
jgi:hypothetical protein